jgi:hypothetical protein
VIDDANLYRYVGNYATGATDPTGLYQKGLGSLYGGGSSLGSIATSQFSTLDFSASLTPSYNASDYQAWATPFAKAPALGGSGTTSYTASAAPKTAAPSTDGFALYDQSLYEQSRAYSGPLHHDVRSGRSYSFGSRGELVPLETYGNEAGRQVLETVGLGVLETAVGVLWEPADWALTAFAIAQEPTNPWNYVGFIPFIPASVRHLGKVDNLVRGVGRYGDEVGDVAGALSRRGTTTIVDAPGGFFGSSQHTVYSDSTIMGRIDTFDNAGPQGTTILGNGQTTRVVPFAERTGGRTLDNGLTEAQWNALSPKQQWKVNDGQLRKHINDADRFRDIGPDGYRRSLDLRKAELQRLDERGIPVETVSPAELRRILGE